MRTVTISGVAAALFALAMAQGAGAQSAGGPPPAAAAVAEPVAAIAPAAAASPAIAASPQVFQVIRADDRELSCEALGQEFNALTASIARQRDADVQARQRLAAEQQKKQQRRGLIGGSRAALSASPAWAAWA